MGKRLEADIETDCVLIAESAGWLHVKLDKAKRSWPDQLFLGPDRDFFFVEFKLPGKRPRPQQRARINTLAALGYEVHVISSVEAFRAVFSRRLRASLSD